MNLQSGRNLYFFTKKQLQSLLGKLSFVTACVKPGRLFMARLLNSLRECKHAASYQYPISATMLLGIQWWLEFLPRYGRISLIKPFLWDFESLNFSIDAAFKGAVPLVKRSASVLSSPTAFLCLLFI